MIRCNIPVIIMGETGCGKTRLLKYLCDLQAKAFGTKNMLCLKVNSYMMIIIRFCIIVFKGLWKQIDE